MATHVIKHPLRGKCFINLGRYERFTVRFSKGNNSNVPEVYPTDQFETVMAAFRAVGASVDQIAWITPHILIEFNEEFGCWDCGCTAEFNGNEISCLASGDSPELAKSSFWTCWNRERLATNTPTHLAILLPNRYRVILRKSL